MSAFSFFRRSVPGRPQREDQPACPDVELVLAARQQDAAGKSAFVEIVRRHQDAVAAVAFGVAGRTAWVDDITQETFLRAWQRLATLREPGKLKAWLTKIAHGCAVAALRRQKPEIPLEEVAIEALAADIEAPDAAAISAEEETVVRVALQSLPEEVRLPLVLFYHQGQSSAEVAAALNLSDAAVRQRLSRGREMLREQVLARIEGVLRRVRPGPHLLVTVASAIGLTGAPEAVAAGTLSGKTAGFSSATTHALAAAAALAICVPLGWSVRGTTHPERSPASGTATHPADPLAEFADGALLREWRRLHKVHGSGAAAMPVIYAEIESLPREFHRKALHRALLTEWSRLDPAGGFDFLRGKKQTVHTKVFMQEWLRRDAENAALHLAASAAGNRELTRSLLAEVAELAPQHLAAVVEAMTPPDGEGHAEVTAAFTVFAAKDPSAARAAAEGMSGNYRAAVFAGVAAGWAERDGAAALAWARTLPKISGRDEAARAAISGWAKRDPVAALDQMKDVRANHKTGDYRETVMRAAVERDFEAVMRWIPAHIREMNSSRLWDQLTDPLMVRFRADRPALLKWIGEQPKEFRKGLIMAMATGVGKSAASDQEAVWQWMNTLPPGTDDPFHQTRTFFMNRTGPRIQELAIEWMKTLPQDKWESRTFIENFVRDGLYREHPSAETLERLAENFPDHLRAGVYPALLKEKTDWNETELAKWAQRIAEAPEFDRARYAVAAAESISAIEPEAAVRWSMALQGDKERNAALGTTIGKWAQADAASASEWVNELPRGRDRDLAASRLVNAIAEAEPDAAWAWTLSIEDVGTRSSAARSLLSALNQKDPARARQLAQAPELDDSLRAWFKREYLDPPERPERNPEEEDQ